jgi:uncharacterized protein
MDRIFTDIRRNDQKAAQSAPHPVEISIVLPEDPPTDEPTAALEVGLLSRQTTAAVDSAFNALARAVREQNSQTLEELVRETLQPRLKCG